MSDLIERLRAAGWTGRNSLPDMAADEIERLTAIVESPSAVIIQAGVWHARLVEIERLQARVDALEARCNHEFPPMKFGGPPRQCLRCGETEGRAIKALEGEVK